MLGPKRMRVAARHVRTTAQGVALVVVLDDLKYNRLDTSTDTLQGGSLIQADQPAAKGYGTTAFYSVTPKY